MKRKENKLNILEVTKLVGTLFAFTFGILALVILWIGLAMNGWKDFFQSLM